MGFLFVPYSEIFREHFFFYMIFSILWMICGYLIWFGSRFLKYVIVAAVTIPGVMALLSYLGGYSRVAVISGSICLGVLLSLIAIVLIIITLFLGPAVLAGVWVHHLLGSNLWSSLMGAVLGLGSFYLTFQFLRKVVIPYSHGFGLAMLGGLLAHDLSNIFFRIQPSYLLNTGMESFFHEIETLNFHTLENGIVSTYLFLSWLLSGFGVRNWIIIAGAFSTGIFFIIQRMRVSPSPTK